MDLKTILSLIARHGLTTLGGTLATHGYLGSGNVEQFVGAGMIILGVGWSWWQKSGQAAVSAKLGRLTTHVEAINTSAPPGQVAAAVETAKRVAALLVLAVVLAALAPVPAAYAQVRKPQITGNIVADTKANLGITKPGDAPALTGDPVADLHNAIKKGGAKLLMHLKQQYALAISPGSDGSTQVDPIAAPCAKALVPIVDLVVNGPKATTVAPPDAMALTADEQTAAADASELDGVLVQVEKIRILRIAVQGNALTIACGPLVQDEVKQAKNLMGGITSLITGAGLLAPIGL